MSAAVEPASGPTLSMAIWLRDRGWRPFPLDHPDLPVCIGLHHPDRNPCDGKRGKHPVAKFGTACNVVPQDGMLRTWFGGQARNIGIACGPSGLLVVDEDELDALTRFAEERGHDIPLTYRVRTRRGWHYYFDAAEYPELGNSPGLLEEYGMDVRGAGGFVVGAGSVHLSGHVYEAEDEHTIPAALPEWLAEAVQTKRGEDGSEVPSEIGRFSDAVRYGTEAELKQQYRKRVDAIRSKGNSYRTEELFPAARDGWRLVHLGLLEIADVHDDLADAIRRVWGAEPDLRDKHIVDKEARDAALKSPWALTNVRQLGKDPAGGLADRENERGGAGVRLYNAGEYGGGERDTPTSSVERVVHDAEVMSEEEIERRAFERVVQERLRWHEADAEARRRQAAKAAVGRVSIRSGLIDSNALDQIEPPRMLMGELIPHASMGFLGGDTGTYKSFVAISWACHLAAGRAWLGREEFAVDEPVRVLYVAAEGAAGVAQRIESWKADNGPMPAGHMVLYPRSIDLTDRIAVEELAEIIAEDEFGLVVIDTLHQSTPGSEENSSTEFGVVFSAMSAIRHHHSATVLFVDHTGHDGTRLRGTAAKGQAADFVVMAARNGENVPTSQRSIRITKRKDLATEGSWPIHLRPVEGTRSAVVQIGENGGAESPFSLRGGIPWWQHELEEQLPETVVRVAGHGADTARDAFRVLRYANDDLGYSISAIVKALKERPGHPDYKPPSESTVRRAMRLLSDAGVVFAQGVKYHLQPEFRP